LIVDHLKTVRTLDEYVNGDGLLKDMQDLSNHLRRDLSRSILLPAGWKDLRPSKGRLYFTPESVAADNALISKWCVVDDALAIEIYPAGSVWG